MAAPGFNHFRRYFRGNCGEIADEFDPDSDELIRPDKNGVYELDGTMTIRDINRAMDWSLPDEHANTLAGLVYMRLK